MTLSPTDTTSQVVSSRLRDIMGSTQCDRASQPASQPEENLCHFYTPTLPHLLALLAHPSESFPPRNTSLIVIDSVSSLFALAYPRKAANNADQAPQRKRDPSQWAAGRRWAVMNDFISTLGRLAATRNIAILLLSQTTTKIRSDVGAMLNPAISGTGWDNAIANRVILFRDWLLQNENGETPGPHPDVRFAGVLKAKGTTYEGTGKLTAFTIKKV